MEIKLNLIPPSRKEEIAKNNNFKLAIRIEILLTIIFVIFLAVLFFFQYIINLNLSSLAAAYEKNENLPKYNKIKDYDGQFEQVNSLTGEVLSVKRSQLYWTILFIKLNGVVFSGITINSLSTQDYLITLKGTAKSRSDLILFKEKLDNEQCFSNVDLPISDLVNKDNVNFQINFLFKEDCIKNK